MSLIEGPKIPQGLVLFFVGIESPAPVTSRRRQISSAANDRHGFLVPLPESHEAAAQIALNSFGKELDVSTTADIVLKRTLRSASTFSNIYAEFNGDDWEKVMVGPELEIAVFKARATEDEKEAKNDIAYDAFTPIPVTPCYTPASNPWLTGNTFGGGWNYNPSFNKDKTVLLTCVSQSKHAEGKVVDISGNPTHPWESSLLGLPESYEACEQLARETFNPPSGSKMTMRVLKNPSAMVSDYLNTSEWTKVHPTAYASAIGNYAGALEIRVDFEGGASEEAKIGVNSGDFLMI